MFAPSSGFENNKGLSFVTAKREDYQWTSHLVSVIMRGYDPKCHLNNHKEIYK
jgi:hypothetical protein